VVRINDRGPYKAGRIIDLSQAAAQAIGLDGIDDVFLTEVPPES
jgi:rare lipoprotein A